VGRDDLAIPEGGVLEGAPLGSEVHADEAEEGFVALGPLEVVHERPLEIASQRDALGGGTFESVEITVQEFNAGSIMDATGSRRTKGVGRTCG